MTTKIPLRAWWRCPECDKHSVDEDGWCTKCMRAWYDPVSLDEDLEGAYAEAQCECGAGIEIVDNRPICKSRCTQEVR